MREREREKKREKWESEEKNKFIEKIATENVDINALGLYTLGKIRKDLDENKLGEYQELFKKYFLKSTEYIYREFCFEYIEKFIHA